MLNAPGAFTDVERLLDSVCDEVEAGLDRLDQTVFSS